MNKKQKEVRDRIQKAQERLGKLMDELMAGTITTKEAKALSAKEDAELIKLKKELGPLPLTPKRKRKVK